MKQLLIVAIIAFVAARPGIASEETEVMAAVNQFVDAFNNGDIKTITSAGADVVFIVDEFSPYEWHGTRACAKWSSDYDADAKKNGITEGHATLSKATHIDVAGDRAYVVGPANYSYKQNGKSVKEVGSVLTTVLQKNTTGWHIIGWAWAKH